MMKKVQLCTDAVATKLNPYGISIFEKLLVAAKISEGVGFSLTDNAEDADLIIFVEPRDYFQTNILKSRFYANHANKLIVFSQQDHCIPRIPGIYNRIPTYLHSVGIYEYGFYSKVFEFNKLDDVQWDVEKPYLYSFIGNGLACPKVRQKILKLLSSSSLLVDTQIAFQDTSNRYIQSIAGSFFVLCPRGLGPSSFRLFETMRAGRVPVIISDEWRPIHGIPWDDFSIRIRENEIDNIPDILKNRLLAAEEMGREARRIYNKYFSQKNAFPWLVETAVRLLVERVKYKKHISRMLFFDGVRNGLIKSTLMESFNSAVSREKDIAITASS